MAGHGEHVARWRSGENTGGGNGKMRPYVDSKCLAKGWRFKHGTRQSCWHDQLENGVALAALHNGKAGGNNGELKCHGSHGGRAQNGDAFRRNQAVESNWTMD